MIFVTLVSIRFSVLVLDIVPLRLIRAAKSLMLVATLSFGRFFRVKVKLSRYWLYFWAYFREAGHKGQALGREAQFEMTFKSSREYEYASRSLPAGIHLTCFDPSNPSLLAERAGSCSSTFAVLALHGTH